MTKILGSNEVLISERGLREGDVIDLNPETNCITIFSPKERKLEFRWRGGDDKMQLYHIGSSDFFQIADLIAQTHGMFAESYKKHFAAEHGHVAFIFKKKIFKKRKN